MATKSLCSIPSCNKTVRTERCGLCNSHYRRNLKHGSPLGGGEARDGSFRACSVQGCEKRRYGNGYCMAHYKRHKRYGDPLGGGAFKGDHLAFIHDVALSFSAPECLRWPFGTISEKSYGVIQLKDGTPTKAHRYICELVNGPPTSEALDAAHSCGDRSCVNPTHLSWKTRAENMADKLIHGTHNRGERSSSAKLTEDQVKEIRRSAGLVTQSFLAKKFGVARQTITNIHTGIRWAWLPD